MNKFLKYLKKRWNNLLIKREWWKSKRRQRKLLKGTDFTIISNNCWGSFTYQKYGLIYRTPTIGLSIMEEDFVKMCQNLKYYMCNAKFIFIKPEESKYYEFLSSMGSNLEYPIGLLDDIEVHFIHYKTEQEAIEKWERRAMRINWNKILIKLSDRGQMTLELLKNFSELPYEHKVFFAGDLNWIKEYPQTIYVPELQGIGKSNIDETPYDYARCDTTILINKLYQ